MAIKPLGKKPATPARSAAGSTTATGTAPIKVRAITMGYYDNLRRRAGDVFLLHDPKLFSKIWMERVDPSTPEKITTGAQELKQMHDDALAGKAAGTRATGGEGDNPIDA